MSEKLQQTTDDYEGGSGAGKALPTKSHGENQFNESGGANAAPGETDRYGGIDFASRLARAQKLSK